MATISINGMRFYAYHGCFEEERVIGTNFIVNLSFQIDSSAAELSDNIEDTVNYVDVYECVARQMKQPSHLLENLSHRIAVALKSAFPQIQTLTIMVSKVNPQLGGQMDSVSVELTV